MMTTIATTPLVCTLCSGEKLIVSNVFSCCCGNTLCNKCLLSLMTSSLTGCVDLFPKCPFCRIELNDIAFSLNKEMANVYSHLRVTVVGTPFIKLKQLYSDDKHYFRRCKKCKLCFIVDKNCGADIEMLPDTCGMCLENVSLHVERRCKKCKHGLTRVDGCNSVPCICGVRMCWLCGEIVTKPHTGKLDLSHYCGNYFGKTCVNTRSLLTTSVRPPPTTSVRCGGCSVM